jgi:hypothetical protein
MHKQAQINKQGLPKRFAFRQPTFISSTLSSTELTRRARRAAFGGATPTSPGFGELRSPPGAA